MTIRRLLVANRGEIARRIFRTCRDRGVDTVAVCSPVDADLPFAREADQAVSLPGNPPSASYLDAAAVLAAAVRAGADAVHPGYGFLSENADFAQAVLDAGLVWVGPPPAAIRAMGSKSAARALAESLGVACVPGWSGADQSDERLIAEGARVGVPLLVKAAAGGGGRGMRRVDDLAELPAALIAARHEATSAFGDGTLLLERYVSRPRHIEVQVAADRHGRVVHLGERECSIQRRFQKIIEEAPSPAVSPELREALGEAAIRLTRAVAYEGVGTLEFLLDDQGRFYFLEMNTRLQVEHPVTERVTGVDLVALQLAIAEGAPLPFERVDLRGHAIEARVYAEDPTRGWLPGAGRLLRCDLNDDGDVRVDAGFQAGDEVSIHYDAMIAKVIAWGEDRADATRRLHRSLRRSWVPGVVTNLPLLRDILDHPIWHTADLDTAFLQRASLPGPLPLAPTRGAVAATVFAWWTRRQRVPNGGDSDRLRPSPRASSGGRERGGTPSVSDERAPSASVGRPRRAESPEFGTSPVVPGFRIEGPAIQRDRWQQGEDVIDVRWEVLAHDALRVRVGDAEHRVRVHEQRGDTLDITADGVRSTWRCAAAGPVVDGAVVYVHLGDAEAVMQLVPRFPAPASPADEPGTSTAPTPGVVTRVHVAVGDVVEKGALLLTLEAMKMEHRVTASSAGTVAELRVQPGESVDAGAVLVRISEA